jgi:hypothetical protein
MASATPFGAIYEDIPLDPALGYPAGASVRIRVNPTTAQWNAWMEGANTEAEEAAETPEAKAAAKVAREARLIVALMALYGTMNLPGFDFSNEKAAAATWARTDLADELWSLLLRLPWAIVAARREAIQKNVLRSSPTQISTET